MDGVVERRSSDVIERSRDAFVSEPMLLVALVALVALAWAPWPAAAQAPVIDMLIPSSIVQGSADTSLTVHGSGFLAPILGPTPSPGTVILFPTGEVLPTTFVSSTELTVLLPGSGNLVTRQSMAQLIVSSQLSEQGITAFLNATGGVLCSFADVTCPGPGTVTDATGVVGGWRYIETMFRLGYSDGCSGPGDPLRLFCPTGTDDVLAQSGVFGVRALHFAIPLPTGGALPVASLLSDAVELTIVAPTPTATATSTTTATPTKTATATATSTAIPTSTLTAIVAPAIPAVSTVGIVAMLILVGAGGVLALRVRGGG